MMFLTKYLITHTRLIENLMNEGYQDALVQMDMQRIKDGIAELVIINRHSSGDGIEKGKQNRHIQKLEEDIHQIQENIKIENGKDTTLNDLAIAFLNDVESIQDRSNESGLLLKEGKALLIAEQNTFKAQLIVQPKDKLGIAIENSRGQVAPVATYSYITQ